MYLSVYRWSHVRAQCGCVADRAIDVRRYQMRGGLRGVPSYAASASSTVVYAPIGIGYEMSGVTHSSRNKMVKACNDSANS